MILVTGAAGFIGSHVVERLVARGTRVVGLDSFVETYPVEVKKANLRGLKGNAAFRLVVGDIRDIGLVDSILLEERPEAIVHLAALAGVRPSVEEPKPYMEVNVGGTAVLLSRAAHHGVRRFILASSSSVYGNTSRVPFGEEDPCNRPVSPYGASKRSAELLVSTYHDLTGVDAVILRLFTVFGPRQRPEMAIHRFVRSILAGEPITMFGDGGSKRDYTFVSDIVDGIVAALSAPPGLHTLNLGSSCPVALSELVDAAAVACGKPARIERREAQPGDVAITYADVRRARELLGFEAKVGLREGLERFVNWYRESGPACAPASGND